MPRIRLFAGLLAISLSLAAGCRAQTQSSLDSATNRRIEVLIRSQFNVPVDYNVLVGERKPSSFPGYDSLQVTFSRGEKSTPFDFLISKDGKTLARLETFDLAKNPALNIDTTGRPIRGNPNAKVTVINFDDLECPYCARMHQSLFPATLDRYKDKVRFVYKDDPLIEIHPWAMHAAVNANCLAAQNGAAYWNYVDYLHTHGQEITGPDRDAKKSVVELDRIARQEGTASKLDSAKLDACIARQDETTVRESRRLADSLGIDGTPALFVDGERINGAVPQEQLWVVIDRALRAAGEEPPPPPAPAPQGETGQGAKGSGK